MQISFFIIIFIIATKFCLASECKIYDNDNIEELICLADDASETSGPWLIISCPTGIPQIKLRGWELGLAWSLENWHINAELPPIPVEITIIDDNSDRIIIRDQNWHIYDTDSVFTIDTDRFISSVLGARYVEFLVPWWRGSVVRAEFSPTIATTDGWNSLSVDSISGFLNIACLPKHIEPDLDWCPEFDYAFAGLQY